MDNRRDLSGSLSAFTPSDAPALTDRKTYPSSLTRHAGAMSKKDTSGLRSPRHATVTTTASSSNNISADRARLVRPPVFQRYVDADNLSSSARDSEDRSIFQRYVAENLGSSSSGSPMPQIPVIHSPRYQHHDSTTLRLLHSLGSPRSSSGGFPPAAAQSPFHHTTSAHSSTQARNLQLLRPCSPVGDLPPESVVSVRSGGGGASSPRKTTTPRRAILAACDADKIAQWLQSLEKETKSFSSYFLYCEMLFRESRVLTQGKPVPNRLQTAVAFHCLCKATSVFARHEHLLLRICQDLSAAIFVNHEQLPIGDGEIEALECFSQQLTYYDNQNKLQLQKEHINEAFLTQQAYYECRLKDEQAQVGKMKDLEHRYQINGLDTIAHRNTTHEELQDRLHTVLHNFQYMDDPEKQKVVLTVIESLNAHVTADTLFSITEQMSMHEKDKLLHQLFRDEINKITEKIRSEVVMSSTAQQNAILERSVTRITHFQSLISEMVREKPAEDKTAAATTSGQQPTVATRTSSRALLDDFDLSDQDRKVLELVSDAMDELELEKRKTMELTKKLEEAEQLVTSLRWKNNALHTEAQEVNQKHTSEVEALREVVFKGAVEKVEKEVQTGKRGRLHGSGGDDGNDDEEEEENDGSGGGGNRNSKRRASRRRFGGGNSDEDDLIMKNRRTNKFGVGIASIIEQAKIPSSKIRKILSKRKPLTLNELHAIIVGYYQAKMFQDVQDDNVGKPRNNLAQFIMEMYVLHYGLKDLAISQLVFLDASIRKNAQVKYKGVVLTIAAQALFVTLLCVVTERMGVRVQESARVRIFGLLTGSLDPESHACSVQGIDFFLFVVVVIFNAGVYKKGRKQAVAIAQNLKTIFGDGIFMSPKATTVKSDLVCQSIDLVFSFTRNEPGGALDHLKDELRRTASMNSGSLEIDTVLEKLMNHWFSVYEQQIQDIHAMFALVDTNGDGSLDFREFCDLVVVLEPDIDRREALALYNRAAGDDHVIDKEEFVQVMLAHQRGVILKEFYSGDSNKKIIMGIQQRKSTFAAPALSTIGIDRTLADSSTNRTRSLECQSSFAGAMTELDREESYASLAAAMMNSVTYNMNGMDEDAMGDDDVDEEEQGSGDRVKDSVPFMTLSRLSIWAAEAKGKLQGVRSRGGGESANAVAQSLHKQPDGGSSSWMNRGGRESALQAVAEQEADFEQDVDALLRQALSKVNIPVNDLFES